MVPSFLHLWGEQKAHPQIQIDFRGELIKPTVPPCLQPCKKVRGLPLGARNEGDSAQDTKIPLRGSGTGTPNSPVWHPLPAKTDALCQAAIEK